VFLCRTASRHAGRVRRIKGLTPRAEVRARTEATPGAGHDHRANVIIGVDVVEDGEPILRHLHGKGVQFIRAIERHRHHTSGLIDQHRLQWSFSGRHGHQRFSLPRHTVAIHERPCTIARCVRP